MENQITQRFCHNCGASIQPASAFCPYCGIQAIRPSHEAAAQPQMEQAKPSANIQAASAPTQPHGSASDFSDEFAGFPKNSRSHTLPSRRSLLPHLLNHLLRLPHLINMNVLNQPSSHRPLINNRRSPALPIPSRTFHITDISSLFVPNSLWGQGRTLRRKSLD